MKKFAKFVLKTVKISFIVFCLFLASLFFRSQRIPACWVCAVVARALPENLMFHLDECRLGVRDGLRLHGVRLYDLSRAEPMRPLAEAERLHFDFLNRQLFATGLAYPRLPDSYYAEGNQEKNARVEADLPNLSPWRFDLFRPAILGVTPERVTGTVRVNERGVFFSDLNLVWRDIEPHMEVDGFCDVDLAAQRIRGEVKGLAMQKHIRPMLVDLDVPVSLPYFDGFTDVPEPVPSGCSWDVNLVNNDFNLDLDLHPVLGAYNGVQMKQADGTVRLRNRIRGTWLNYNTTVGPVEAEDDRGRTLRGTVTILGTNGCNTVDVAAQSSLPLAQVLRIGGFEGDYVGEDVFGDSTCALQFRFPRSMTNNYEVLNGTGHVAVANGRLMRMKGLAGLVELMAEKVPGFDVLTDATRGSADYVIENGVIRSDNICIEGSVYSIQMSGTFDAVSDRLDFKVLVLFARKDTWYGKILRPLSWPFSKLLLEFRLLGTAEKPEWKYVTVVDRVLEAGGVK